MFSTICDETGLKLLRMLIAVNVIYCRNSRQNTEHQVAVVMYYINYGTSVKVIYHRLAGVVHNMEGICKDMCTNRELEQKPKKI